MSGYGIERGEVLMSLQLALTREEDGLADLAKPPAIVPAVPPRPLHRAALPPTRRRRLPLPSDPPAPRRPIVMVDPTTGAGTMAALRRDLALQGLGGGGIQGRMVGLEIAALDQFRLVLGPDAAEEVIRGVVEVAPFALQARDRVYRLGREKLIVWLMAGKDSEVERARSGLEAAVTRFLADRGFPEVRLMARPLDPAAVAR